MTMPDRAVVECKHHDSWWYMGKEAEYPLCSQCGTPRDKVPQPPASGSSGSEKAMGQAQFAAYGLGAQLDDLPFEESLDFSDDRTGKHYVILHRAALDDILRRGAACDPEVIERPAAKRPTVVCLCGSTRFWREFQRSSLAETLAGRIVLSIGAATGTDDEHFGNLPAEEYARIKEDLDQLHLRKVEMADEVLILNVDGYVGESTARELAHAFALGKRIRFLEPEMGKVNAALGRAALVEIAAAPPLAGDAAYG